MITKDTNESRWDMRSRPGIAAWAHSLFDEEHRGTWCILDSETTGLHDAEIIDLAIIDSQGNVPFNSLIRPRGAIEADAMAVHRITEEMVAGAPTFLAVWPAIFDALSQYRRILVYNAEFDAKMLMNTARKNGLSVRCDMADASRLAPRDAQFVVPGLWQCLMHIYATYYGQRHASYGSFRWQALSAALRQQGIEHRVWHRALGDAEATLKLLKALAAQHTESEGNDGATTGVS